MLLGCEIGSICEIDSDRSWDPVELRQEAVWRARRYLSLGIRETDRCLIAFGNRLEFFAELLALWRLGACAIPVDADLSERELGILVAAVRPALVIVDDHAVPRAALSDVRTVRTSEHGCLRAPDLPSIGLRLDGDALMLFTSGSTGEPKGVVHTHRSLLARWTALQQALGLRAFERSLCLLPTHFGHGLICNCLFPWLSGCDLYVAPPSRPDLLLHLGETVDRHKITFLSSVPSLWNLTLRGSNAPESHCLRRVHIGSAPLSSDTWRQVQHWSGTRAVSNTYGITETGSWLAGTVGEVEPADGLIGNGWGAQLLISPARSADELADGHVEGCRRGEEGMIWIRTPALMKSYYRLPELTDKAVCHGWFKSGDIGLIDSEGRLFVRGRERDEINKAGMKIHPGDIDAVVADDENVLDVCTFGFEDEAYGENVALAVVLKDRLGGMIGALHARLEEELSQHKRPVKWYVLDEIPRTDRGKVNRAQVGERCAEMQPVNPQEFLNGTDGSR